MIPAHAKEIKASAYATISHRDVHQMTGVRLHAFRMFDEERVVAIGALYKDKGGVATAWRERSCILVMSNAAYKSTFSNELMDSEKNVTLREGVDLASIEGLFIEGSHRVIASRRYWTDMSEKQKDQRITVSVWIADKEDEEEFVQSITEHAEEGAVCRPSATSMHVCGLAEAARKEMAEIDSYNFYEKVYMNRLFIDERYPDRKRSSLIEAMRAAEKRGLLPIGTHGKRGTVAWAIFKAAFMKEAGRVYYDKLMAVKEVRTNGVTVNVINYLDALADHSKTDIIDRFIYKVEQLSKPNKPAITEIGRIILKPTFKALPLPSKPIGKSTLSTRKFRAMDKIKKEKKSAEDEAKRKEKEEEEKKKQDEKRQKELEEIKKQALEEARKEFKVKMENERQKKLEQEASKKEAAKVTQNSLNNFVKLNQKARNQKEKQPMVKEVAGKKLEANGHGNRVVSTAGAHVDIDENVKCTGVCKEEQKLYETVSKFRKEMRCAAFYSFKMQFRKEYHLMGEDKPCSACDDRIVNYLKELQLRGDETVRSPLSKKEKNIVNEFMEFIK